MDSFKEYEGKTKSSPTRAKDDFQTNRKATEQNLPEHHPGQLRTKRTWIECDKHSNFVIDFFCLNHDAFCCRLCLDAYHRYCDDTCRVFSATKAQFFNPEVHKPTQTTEELIAKVDSIIENTRTRQKEIKKKIDDTIPATIKSIRKDLNSWLETNEKNTVEIGVRWFENLEKEQYAVSRAIDSLKPKLNNVVNESITQHYSKDKIPAFILLKQNQAAVSEAKIFLEAPGRLDNDIQFTPESGFLSTLSLFGEAVAYNKYTARLCDVQSKQSFSFRLPTEKDCTIEGICQMPDDSFVVSDSANSKIILLDEKFNVLTFYKTIEFPHGVCHIYESDFAVAVDCKVRSEIHFMRVSGSENNKAELRIDKTIRLVHECIGIVYKNDSLFVSSYKSVYEYTRNGELIKLIYEDPVDRYGLRGFWLSCNCSQIYIIDQRHALTKADRKGIVISSRSYENFYEPTGMCVDENDNIFVCCIVSPKVQMFNRRRRRLATLNLEFEGRLSPKSIWYDNKKSRLIIGGQNIYVIQLPHA